MNIFSLNCVSKKDPRDIIDCNLKKNQHILIVLDRNIADTSDH